MKYIVVIVALCIGTIMVSGCDGSPVNNYVENKILRDKTGCAFIMMRGRSRENYMTISFSREESADTCQYIEPRTTTRNIENT